MSTQVIDSANTGAIQSANNSALQGSSNRSLGRRYHTLDGLRGIAALFVAAYHFGSRDDAAVFPGYLAVDLFFVLSGFVIALNYQQRLAAGMTIQRFAQVRLIRLCPMYAIGLVLGFLKQLAGLLKHDPRVLGAPALVCSSIAGALMLPSPCSPKLFPLNPPSWSLFFEIAINLLFGAWMWKATSRTIFLVTISCLIGLALTIGAPMYFNVGWSWATAYAGVLRASFAFPLGVLIFRGFNCEKHVTWTALLPVFAMVAMFAFQPSGAWRATEQLIAVAFVFPAIVMLGIRLEAPGALARIFNFLGDISYPVYAVHYPLVPLFLLIFSRLGLSPSSQVTAFVAILFVIGYAAAHIDTRIRKTLTKIVAYRDVTSTNGVQASALQV